MKRLLSLLLAAFLAVSVLALPARAADPTTAQGSAQLLYDLGLFRGTGIKADGTPEFELNRAATRAEAVTMLVRMLGEEDLALAAMAPTPFLDVLKEVSRGLSRVEAGNPGFPRRVQVTSGGFSWWL